MHPTTLILVAVAIGAAGVLSHRPPDNMPATQYWEEAMPHMPMPEALAELVQQGIHDYAPLAKNFAGPYHSIGMCLGHIYDSVCSVESMKAAATGLFFHEDQVRVGSTMTVSMPEAVVPAFLPHNVAEKAFPIGKLSVEDVISRFNIAPDSETASQISDTLRRCQAPAHAGERKACANSLEDEVCSSRNTLGLPDTPAGRAQVWVAASDVPRTGLRLQPYTVEAVTPLPGEDHVACHDEPFPFALFRCYKVGLSGTRAYLMSLRGLRVPGPAVTMAALCHLETSSWNPAYPAFEMMGTKPGGAPVCHFMPYANLLLGKKTAAELASL